MLPAPLLEQLQEYIAGELIYIPKKDEKRKGWGEVNGARRAIQQRNDDIYKSYQKGTSIRMLAAKYHLSEDSIRKIVLCGKAKARKRS